MIAYNMCYTTIIFDLETSGYTIDQVVLSPIGIYFLKKEVKEGMLPRILTNLLAQRKATKREMVKYEEGSDKYNVFNQKQLCEKISCNSIYGITGAPTGKLYCESIAASVTAWGRYHIEQCIQESAKFGWRTTYGISIFFTFLSSSTTLYLLNHRRYRFDNGDER